MIDWKRRCAASNLQIAASAALLATACGPGVVRQAAEELPDAAYLAPQQMITIGEGRRLNLYCTGKGDPTVVLEAGLTDPMNVWSLVQPRLSSSTRVCSYDRAGIGFSDPQTRPSNSANIVDDLHALLAKADISRPVLLVGHSAGGMHVRLYAYTYPEEVAGLVLVDPSHEDQTEGFRSLDPKRRSKDEWDEQVLQPSLTLRAECIQHAAAGIAVGSSEHKKCGFPQYPQLSDAVKAATDRTQLSEKFQRAQLSEEQAIFHSSALELQQARRVIEGLPVIVLTKDRAPPPPEPMTEDEAALREARYQLWVDLGARSAETSAEGAQRIVPGAGHGMPLENPDTVVSAAIEILEIAKAKGKPPTPRD
jgi:pimeloyl-ACP methyl ester carboxylesterase